MKQHALHGSVDDRALRCWKQERLRRRRRFAPEAFVKEPICKRMPLVHGRQAVPMRLPALEYGAHLAERGSLIHKLEARTA